MRSDARSLLVQEFLALPLVGFARSWYVERSLARGPGVYARPLRVNLVQGLEVAAPFWCGATRDSRHALPTHARADRRLRRDRRPAPNPVRAPRSRGQRRAGGRRRQRARRDDEARRLPHGAFRRRGVVYERRALPRARAPQIGARSLHAGLRPARRGAQERRPVGPLRPVDHHARPRVAEVPHPGERRASGAFPRIEAVPASGGGCARGQAPGVLTSWAATSLRRRAGPLHSGTSEDAWRHRAHGMTASARAWARWIPSIGSRSRS